MVECGAKSDIICLRRFRHLNAWNKLVMIGPPPAGSTGQGEIIRACASDVLNNQSMLERFWLGHKAQRLDVSSHVDSAEGVTVFPETTFLHINEAY